MLLRFKKPAICVTRAYLFLERRNKGFTVMLNFSDLVKYSNMTKDYTHVDDSNDNDKKLLFV